MVDFMKSFKNHFSVILSLFVLLCSFQCIVVVNKIIKEYEKNLIDDYSIIVVSKESLDKEELMKRFSIIKSIDDIDSSNIIKRFEKDIPNQNLATLQNVMPKFYSFKLNEFPTTSVSEELKRQLLRFNSIDKVEIFAKTYDKVYKVLKLLHAIVLFFTIIVCIISILLIFKQLRIWIYEHQERINIMTLFGAPFWTKSAVLYKMAIVDSIIAVFLSIGLFLYFSQNEYLQDIIKDIGASFPEFDIVVDGLTLLVISLVFAIVSTTYTVIKAHKK